MTTPIIIETTTTTRERLVVVPEERIVCTEHARDATPADLERGGWVPVLHGAVSWKVAHADACRELDKQRARAEKAEADAKWLRGCLRCPDHAMHDVPELCRLSEEQRGLEGLVETTCRERDAAIARAEKAEVERDAFRVELARLTAPGEGSEGEPTDRELASLGPGIPRIDIWRAGERAGVAHERARQQPAKDRATEGEAALFEASDEAVDADLRAAGVDPEALAARGLAFVRECQRQGAKDEELVDLYRKVYETHGGGTIDVSHDDCRRAAVAAVAARVRQERCLVAQAVAANVDIRVCEDDGGGFMVGVHAPGCDEELTRCVPPADVPATLARLLGEVSRG